MPKRNVERKMAHAAWEWRVNNKRPRGWHVPPTSLVLDNDVKIYKVKQPWASALVSGQKDVENRTFELKSTTGFPVWLVVASSKSRPTNDAMRDYKERMKIEYHEPPLLMNVDDVDGDGAALGVILGMVRVIGCHRQVDMPWPSAWHNPPDFAWVIDDSWEFASPIELDANDQFQTSVKLSNRPQYRAVIEEELKKLEAGQR